MGRRSRSESVHMGEEQIRTCRIRVSEKRIFHEEFHPVSRERCFSANMTIYHTNSYVQ